MREAPLGLDVKRLVILCPSWVGDTVMATPVLRAAREALPQARIIAAARPGLDQLLAGLPWIDDVLSAETKGVVGALRTTRLIRTLRPDAVLVLPNSFRSALIARGCGAPVRIGYDRDARGRLLTARLPAPAAGDEPVSTLEHYLALGRFALGVDRIDPRMELIVTDAEQRTIGAIRAMRTEGLSFTKIAETLTAQSIPTKSGNGKKWNQATIRGILKRQSEMEQRI